MERDIVEKKRNGERDIVKKSKKEKLIKREGKSKKEWKRERAKYWIKKVYVF